MRTQPKLAVILHADVAGSTALVQRDETLAHEQITQAFHRFRNIIERYNGIVHEIRGDAVVAEFARASDAVCAALSFQQQHIAGRAERSDAIAPALRIGISLGEVIFADGTVTGAGVVLAQRVEQFAEPDGVCITAAVNEALPQRVPVRQVDLGEQQAKGFEEPVRVYALFLRDGAALPEPVTPPNRTGSRIRGWAAAVLGAGVVVVASVLISQNLMSPGFELGRGEKSHDPSGEDPASDEKTAAALLDQSETPSIAVLPFTNMGGDPEQDYFADGITEDLTTDLSKISGLFVISRNSSFAYKGSSFDVREIARELGVRFVLEGSVRRASNRLRINAQLIDASTGGHVWAERFDGTMADVFSFQDEVNKKIVAALAISLTQDDRARLGKAETSNPDAYDMLLRGYQQYQYFTSEANIEARRLFKQAIDLDPAYARAYANVALTYGTEVNFSWAEEPQESVRLGLEYAARAVALNANIPQIYLTRSMLYMAQRRHDAAVEAARRTVEVHPNYADGHAALAFVLSYAGLPEEALGAMRRAKEINPGYSYIYLAIDGRVLFLLGRYEEAAALLEQSIERNPEMVRARLSLAATYGAMDRIDDAEWMIEEVLTLRPDLSLESILRETSYRRPEDIDHYINALRKAGLPEV